MMLLRAYLNCDIIAPTLGPSHLKTSPPPACFFTCRLAFPVWNRRLASPPIIFSIDIWHWHWQNSGTISFTPQHNRKNRGFIPQSHTQGPGKSPAT